MKKRMAVLLTFVLIVGLCVTGVTSKQVSYAKAAQVQIEIPDAVKKENEFQIKIILDSDVDLYSIDAHISYNADLLEFIPTDDCIAGAEGVLELKDTYEAETKNAVYEITFKALDVGAVEVALNDVYLIDYADMDYITVSSSAKSFQIGINKEEEDDARLSDLLVAPGSLAQTFRSNQFRYEMHVESDVEMVAVSAIPVEEESIVDLEMPEILQKGKNTIVITVTAPSGHTNTYTIQVYRN